MKVLFIGASGFVGSHVVPFLNGTIDLTLAASSESEVAGLPVTAVDIVDWERTKELLAHGDSTGSPFDTVIYCATASYAHTHCDKHHYYESCIDVNVRGTYHVFEAARLAGVKRVIHIGSNTAMMGALRVEKVGKEVINQANDLYAATKIFGEQLGRSYAHQPFYKERGTPPLSDMSVICLRLGQPFVSQEQWLDSRQWRTTQPVHMGDIARAIECALQTQTHFGIYPIISAVNNSWILPEAYEELGYTPGWEFDTDNKTLTNSCYADYPS